MSVKAKHIKNFCVGLVLLGISSASAEIFGVCCPTPPLDICCPCRRQGWYIGAGGGVTWHNNENFNGTDVNLHRKYDIGGEGFASIGYMYDCWRLEIEGAYRYNGIDKATEIVGAGRSSGENGHNRDITIMGNVFYDLYFNNCFGIFIGGGIGIDFNEIDTKGGDLINTEKKKNTVFAWQIMPGFFYDFTDQVTLDIGYRFFSTTKVKTKLVTGNSFTSHKIPIAHNIEARLRIKL